MTQNQVFNLQSRGIFYHRYGKYDVVVSQKSVWYSDGQQSGKLEYQSQTYAFAADLNGNDHEILVSLVNLHHNEGSCLVISVDLQPLQFGQNLQQKPLLKFIKENPEEFYNNVGVVEFAADDQLAVGGMLDDDKVCYLWVWNKKSGESEVLTLLLL